MFGRRPPPKSYDFSYILSMPTRHARSAPD
jgi:hypothetical protein